MRETMNATPQDVKNCLQKALCQERQPLNTNRDSEVTMKPKEEVARELESQGWIILWQAAVEAVANEPEALDAQDLDTVELIESLGGKLRRTGKEYVGLCPLYDDHRTSLSVNREKGLWHYFRCGRSGTIRDFAEAYRRSHFSEKGYANMIHN